MKTELQQLFLEEIRKNFGFLQPKFKGPFVSEGYCSLEVVYIGNNLAIEFVLDEREQDLSCYIAQVVDGKPVPHGFIGPQGKRVRELLRHLLREQGIRGNLSIPVAGLSLKERIPITLAGLARILQEYGKEVIEDNPRFLNVQSQR
jgi:hypothetical protein